MLRIETIPVTPFSQNARLISDIEAGVGLLIDPGGEPERILKSAEAAGVSVKEVWLTHSHLDHVGGVAEIIRRTGAKLIGHPLEKDMRKHVVQICQMYGLPSAGFENAPEPDTYVQGGEVLRFANHDFQVIFTPGHSPGHVCFYQPEAGVLLGGDVLFQGSIGRTDLPGGDHETLLKSIDQLMKRLPMETRVLSGHGPDTTLGEERQSNPFLVGAFS